MFAIWALGNPFVYNVLPSTSQPFDHHLQTFVIASPESQPPAKRTPSGFLGRAKKGLPWETNRVSAQSICRMAHLQPDPRNQENHLIFGSWLQTSFSTSLQKWKGCPSDRFKPMRGKSFCWAAVLTVKVLPTGRFWPHMRSSPFVRQLFLSTRDRSMTTARSTVIEQNSHMTSRLTTNSLTNQRFSFQLWP